MKTAKDVKARCQVGTRLLCVENTYAPIVNGKVRTVTKAGPSVMQCEQDGTDWRHEWHPGIVVIDADTFRMPLDTLGTPRHRERMSGHSVTLRFLVD